ncbi:UNVERIFIED_CONTAM: hypothetical protein Scaly_1413400 [Sesamum calycinum]|uniref:Transposase n=1 Tax=Sesamum calycinum TaxID=2727403 RepID=A0AAW2PN52_9LAMI
MGEILPCDHTFSLDYYHTKKLITELGLSVVKIDACKNDCMLYWKDDIKFESCKFCGDPRYKLQKAQNYQVTKSAYTVLRLDDHPSDAEAWRHFDCTYPYFTMEPQNVRLGLCVDEFVPHRQYGKMNSCWPMILTLYNLPQKMFMKSEFIFLTLVIPGLSNPKHFIDVYMQSLIEELLQLWHMGVRTYDRSANEFFIMRAALM